MSQPVLLSLERVHSLPRRVRFRLKVQGGFDRAALVRQIELLDGVQSARMNSQARTLVVHFDPKIISIEHIENQLRQMPLHSKLSAGNAAPEGMSCILGSAALLAGGRFLPQSLKIPTSLAAALPIFAEAVEDLRSDGITSHVLEALAVAISVARRDFTAANATIFMLALGEYLEESIARRSDTLLKQLLRPNTDQVWIEENGQERQIASTDVKVGMTVIAGAGMTIPIDGTVLGGEAFVNESAMTGESKSVCRKRGDAVLSGTVIEDGRIRIYAEHVGADTAAARIADYVEQSLSAKSSSQLQASQLADRLVPAVLGLAGGAWLMTGDWQRAAAVLQADYSCALKLATPVAFKAAMYRSGKQGILFKGGNIVERLAEADTFVFDKTGTLTTGKLAVTDSITFDPNYSPEDLIDLAASVEEHYFHPLALAVVEAAKKQRDHQHFDHKEVEFIAAHGVASVIDGKRIVVGSRHFVLEDEGISIANHGATLDALYQQGKTVLYIGFGNHLLGVIALKDEIRPESAATMARLRRLGVKKLVMLTGDHSKRASEIAEELGLDEFHAELLPEQKAELVAKMRDRGDKIAFVGDGINDAPALACAHVGIAMQQGADIARLTSDIALLEDGIEQVAEAKAIAKATLKRIDHNFKLTVGANTAILAGAALGKLSPVASSIAHNGSTIAILLNALRNSRAEP